MTLFVVAPAALEVYIGGVLDPRAYAVEVRHSLARRYAEARIFRTLATKVSGPVETEPSAEDVTYWAEIEIRAGSASPPVRFQGWMVPVEYRNWPKDGVLICRGYLYLAEYLRNDLEDGTDFSGLADEDIVKTILSQFGFLSLASYNSSNIDGTGITLGDLWTASNPLADGPFHWPKGETGLAFIDRLDAISVPDDASGRYRTYETRTAAAVRTLLTSNPSGLADYTFTEDDILEGSSLGRDPAGAANRIVVSGFNYGDLDGPIAFVVESAFAPYLPSIVPDSGSGFPVQTLEFSSPMLEKETIAETPPGPGTGISCQAVADLLLSEHNAVLERVQIVTARRDEFDVGETMHVTSTRLNTDEDYLIEEVMIRYEESGQYTAILTGLRQS
jgi:hypothetical protein